MYTSRAKRLITLALVTAGLSAAPTAALAAPADMHASTAIAAAEANKVQDLRNPDNRVAPVSGPTQDLRSPDSRDAAAGRGTFSAPEVVVVKVSEPQPVAGGIDWGDAGIGAGTLVGLTLITLGSALFVVHRRRTHSALAS
jgi:hypothetical protein